MVDKIKPIKFETLADGSQDDMAFQTEANPIEDYIASKGIAFENLDTHLIQKLGRNILPLVPDRSSKVVYLSNGEIDQIEIFNGVNQISANRIFKVVMAYDGNLNPTSETWSLYDTNGVTVLRTVVLEHDFTGVDYDGSESVTT